MVTIPQHISKLCCTEWYDLLNTYIVLSDVGLVDAVEVSMYVYVCTLIVSNPTIRMLVAYGQYSMNWHQMQAPVVALVVASSGFWADKVKVR
jgi:hypothetical protein